MTVEELIALSMREIDVLADGETPTTSEYALGLSRLNSLLSSLQNDMVFLLRQDTSSITTVANQKAYPTESGTKKVRYFTDRDVNVLSRKGYDQFTTPVTDRTDLYIEYNTEPPTIFFAVTPTTDGDVFTFRRDNVITVLTLSDDLDFSDGINEMLLLGLAFKLCGPYRTEVGIRESTKVEYNEELNKYRQAQTVRVGTEIVKPSMNVV